MTRSCDFLIVGAGIAGASAGYELAAHGRVVVLEGEDMPGYHATGRSAALYTETYGNAVVRGITSASRAFYIDPPDGFVERPMLTPRGTMIIGREDQGDRLATVYDDTRRLLDSVRRLDSAEALALVPVLRGDQVAGAVFEPDSMDMDVNAIHQAFLRGLRGRGGEVVTAAGVTALTRADGLWRAATPAGEFAAPVLVNAAGAWADMVAGMAEIDPVGLVPMRRTVIVFDPPEGIDFHAWPSVIDADEEFYFKPDGGRILATPADETPSEPCDAQPEELDVAIAVDRVQRASTLVVGRIVNKWAGLRSFVADKTMVVGFEPTAEGFFWLAGQGGYGIQTAPAMGRIAAALATGGTLPPDVAAFGVGEADLAPARFRP